MTRQDGKLVYRSIRAEDGPTSLAYPLVNLQNPLATVKRLIVCASRMADSRIQVVQAHQIQIVWCRQIELPTKFCNSMHFLNGGSYIGNVLNCFARNYQIKGIVAKRQTRGVALDKHSGCVAFDRRQFAMGYPQSRKRKIASGYMSSGARQPLDKASQAARDF